MASASPIPNNFIMLLMKLRILIPVAAGILFVAAAALWWMRRQKAKGASASASINDGHLDNGKEEPATTHRPGRESIDAESETPNAENLSLQSPSATASPSTDLRNLACGVNEPDIKSFLEEIASRIRDEEPNFNDHTSHGFIEEIVDRIDDLRAIAANPDAQNTDIVISFRKHLVEILSACHAELIHSEQWDPSLQRAISKEPTPNITAPAILRHGSSGISRSGQLIRKQEVVLAVPKSNQ